MRSIYKKVRDYVIKKKETFLVENSGPLGFKNESTKHFKRITILHRLFHII